MAKEIPTDQLKAAVNAINTMLDPKIKMITRKKSEIVADFKAKMDVFIEEDTTDQLPEVCVDFYNEFIANEEEEVTEEVKEEKTTSKKTAPKEKKEKAPPKEKKEKKASTGRVASKNPREKSIVLALKKGGTFDELVSLADSIYVENGGTSNIAQSKKLLDRGIKYLEAADVLTKDGNKYVIK